MMGKVGKIYVLFIIYTLIYSIYGLSQTDEPNNLAYGYIYNLTTSQEFISTGIFSTVLNQLYVASFKPPTQIIQFGDFSDSNFTSIANTTFTGSFATQNFLTNAVIDESVNPPVAYWPTGVRSILKMTLSQPSYTLEQLNLPYGFDTQTVCLLRNGWLYIAGYAPGSTYANVLRIPTDNFTSIALSDPANGPISPPSTEGQLLAGAVDDEYAYFGGQDPSNAKIYRVNLKTFQFESNYIVLNIGSLAGGFADPDRGFVYFFSGGSNTAQLIKISTANFTQVGILTFESYANNADNVVTDLQGGHAYFGHFTAPGLITHVNLKLFSIYETFTLPDGQNYLDGGAINANDRNAYFFGDGTPGMIIHIKLPYACLNNCSASLGQGLSCEYYTCTCAAGWTGDDCSAKRCPEDCNGNGVCNSGTCACDPAWTGPNCTVRQCPNQCLGHGICNGAPDFTCECLDNWGGDDCSVYPPVPPCEKLDSCSQCLRNTSCGWCESSAKCVYGDSFGPFESTCAAYTFGDCPSLFYSAIGWLFSAFAFLLLIVSIILTFVQDLTLPENTKAREFVVRFWWRNQLSAKAWHLVDRIQLIAITSYFAITPPAIYSDFIQTFRWSILAFALPWDQPSVVRPLSRNLLDFQFHSRVMDEYFDEIFLANIFWLAIILVGVAFLFGILILISLFVGGSNFKTLARSRLIYSMIRIMSFGYLGIACTSLYTLIFYTGHEGLHSGKTALGVAAAMLVVIVIGLPIFTFAILFNKKKELFMLHFSMKFGCLFQSFHFKKSFFSTIQILKKLMIGVWVGLLYKHPVPQLVLLAVTHFTYFVSLIFVKPYIDHIHFFVDLTVSFLDFSMICLLSGFLHSPHVAQSCAIVVIILHIIAMCVIIGGFVNSIFKMHQIHSVAQFFRVIVGKENVSDSEAMGSRN